MDTNSPPGHPEVVLVVDDEPIVLNLVCAVMEHAGFAVLRASSADEALQIGTVRRDSIALLLCDVMMPGKSGPSLADAFVLIHPETACLFMAGYPDSPEVVDHILGLGRAFLPKPFVPKTLIGKVREVLSGGSNHTMAAPA